MKTAQNTVLPLVLVAVFLALLIGGITFKEVLADGVGSNTGLGNPGSSTFSVQVLYDASEDADKRVKGFHIGPLSGLTVDVGDGTRALYGFMYQKEGATYSFCALYWDRAAGGNEWGDVCWEGGSWGPITKFQDSMPRVLNVITNDKNQIP